MLLKIFLSLLYLDIIKTKILLCKKYRINNNKYYYENVTQLYILNNDSFHLNI